MKTYLQFINENYKNESIKIDFEYFDEDVPELSELIENEDAAAVSEFIEEDLYNILDVKFSVHVIKFRESGVAHLQMDFNNIKDCEKVLDFLYGYEYNEVQLIIKSLVKFDRVQDALDYLVDRQPEKEIEDHLELLPKEFMDNLSDENKRKLDSLKGIKKFDL